MPEMTIKPTSREKLSNFLTRRTFHLTDNVTKKKDFKVVQIHYEGWPDYGVPTNESLNDFT